MGYRFYTYATERSCMDGGDNSASGFPTFCLHLYSPPAPLAYVSQLKVLVASEVHPASEQNG
jgi:hypothetical protein